MKIFPPVALLALPLVLCAAPPADLVARRAQAERGDPAAQAELGAAYSTGAGVTVDKGQALEWFRRAAEQHNALAQYSLGVMFEHGDGVAKNRPEAARWYRLAR